MTIAPHARVEQRLVEFKGSDVRKGSNNYATQVNDTWPFHEKHVNFRVTPTKDSAGIPSLCLGAWLIVIRSRPVLMVSSMTCWDGEKPFKVIYVCKITANFHYLVDARRQ